METGSFGLALLISPDRCNPHLVAKMAVISLIGDAAETMMLILMA